MSQARKDILNGWKEIAAYISRDIRTVERWEKQRGLPVRRIPGSGRGVVYAHISEIERWLAGHPVDLAESHEVPDEPRIEAGVDLGSADLEEAAVPEPAIPEPAAAEVLEEYQVQTPAQVQRLSPWIAWAAALAVTVVGAGFTVRARSSDVRAEKTSAAARPVAHEQQHSSVAGVDDLYLRGAFALEQRTPASLAQARTVLTKAIGKDPGFAPAYAALAETYCLLREYDNMPDAEAWPKAEEFATRAVGLDPQLSDAHAVLGFVDFFWHTETPAADREFQQAIELDPRSVLAHHWYGSVLTHDGRLGEALEQLNTAQRLAPYSFAILTQRALAIGMSGRRDEADALLEEMLQQNRVVGDHDSSTAHIVLAILSLQPPIDLRRAVIEYQRSAVLRHDARMVRRQGELLKALDARGPSGMWETEIRLERKEHPGEVTYAMVQSEAQLGEREQALRDLRTVLGRPHGLAVMMHTDPLLDPIRREPEFALLESVQGTQSPMTVQ